MYNSPFKRRGKPVLQSTKNSTFLEPAPCILPYEWASRRFLNRFPEQLKSRRLFYVHEKAALDETLKMAEACGNRTHQSLPYRPSTGLKPAGNTSHHAPPLSPYILVSPVHAVYLPNSSSQPGRFHHGSKPLTVQNTPDEFALYRPASYGEG